MKGTSILAKNINYLRRRAGLTQRELAQKISCSSSGISIIENDKQKFSTLVPTLAKFFDQKEIDLNIRIFYPPEWGTEESENALIKNLRTFVNEIPSVVLKNKVEEYLFARDTKLYLLPQIADLVGCDFDDLFKIEKIPEKISEKNSSELSATAKFAQMVYGKNPELPEDKFFAVTRFMINAQNKISQMKVQVMQGKIPQNEIRDLAKMTADFGAEK